MDLPEDKSGKAKAKEDNEENAGEPPDLALRPWPAENRSSLPESSSTHLVDHVRLQDRLPLMLQ